MKKPHNCFRCDPAVASAKLVSTQEDLVACSLVSANLVGGCKGSNRIRYTHGCYGRRAELYFSARSFRLMGSDYFLNVGV